MRRERTEEGMCSPARSRLPRCCGVWVPPIRRHRVPNANVGAARIDTSAEVSAIIAEPREPPVLHLLSCLLLRVRRMSVLVYAAGDQVEKTPRSPLPFQFSSPALARLCCPGRCCVSCRRSFMSVRSFVVIAALAATSCSRQVPSLAGDWDATIVNLAKAEVPFHFVIAGSPEQPTGTFVNGEERMASTSGSFKDGQLVISFDQYGSKVIAHLNGDVLEGEYNRTTRGAAYPFRATRAAAKAKDANPPSIAGEWKIPTPEDRHETGWLFIVRQNGADVSAAIQRLDGDTGTLTGSFRDGKLLLSHFSGARPMRLDVTVKPDGSLDLLEDGQTAHSAFRTNDPRAAAADIKDPTQFTHAKDPGAPVVLQFPDLNGTLVSLSDARFRGKVVILSITGSWCPNCHDEAPFFADLYRKYRDQGLEIVLLAFEEAGQLTNPVRLKAFLTQYNITYPVLLVGEPKELSARLPQFADLYAFPTSVYLGRDGRVRGTHVGFSGRATGALYTRTTEEITRTVETLLAEKT